ncbi:MAG: hypothetical protein ACREXP_00040 [Steroidobacteraceae bacterium]
MPPTDWLDTPSPAEPDWLDVGAELPDYLKIPALDAPSPRIEVTRADAELKDIRFQVMDGSSRVWACNGRYVACRPAGFKNSTIRERHERFLRTKQYRHVGTFDDVQLFELTSASPWYRTPGDVRAGTWYEVLRAAAMAATAKDWGAYVDLLEEIATRLKSTPTGTDSTAVDPGLAAERFADTLAHLEQLIFMRWPHSIRFVEDSDYGLAMTEMQGEIDRGVSELRRSRGTRSSAIAQRRGPLIIR